LPPSSDRFRFFVTCARGTEGALRRELVGLRIGSPKGDTGGVWFEGPIAMAMGVCLHSRVAVRVLLQLATFEVGDADSLYRGAQKIGWADWLTLKTTLAVHATVRDNPALTHSGFAALKVKDALVDVLRDKLGARPDVAPKDPDVSIVLHVAGTQAGVFLDLAGEALHRRGYRVAMVDAPLKETLAASVLALGGVGADLPFIDPMGGSGTLAIEQALASRGIAPGLRRKFGFQRWPMFAGELQPTWSRLHNEAIERAKAPSEGLSPIVCSDIARASIDSARRNATAAGVVELITFEVADVSALAPRWPTGNVCTNPPYGERLVEKELGALYRKMAVAFARMPRWAVVVLSGNPLFTHEMGKKPRISHRLYNGALEVRLLRYEL
jgi:putative N6-adenine-specific DNA methylase